MTAADEHTLKKWLFTQWKETHSPKFFLAGAVIGKVKDMYSLAIQYGIDDKAIKNFWRKFECFPPITNINKLVMLRSLYRWAKDKDVPPDVAGILRAVGQETSSPQSSYSLNLDVVDAPQFEFTDEEFNPYPDEDDEEAWLKRLQAASDKLNKGLKNWERDLYINLVSRSESARKYESFLRTMYRHKSIGLSGFYFARQKAIAESIGLSEIYYSNKHYSDEILAEVKEDTENFFAEKIKYATTKDEIYSVWLRMSCRKLDVEEILECVKEQMMIEGNNAEGESWRKSWGLETFFTFVKNWQSYRDKEIEEIELKAQLYDVDLRQMLEDDIAQREQQSLMKGA